MFENRRTLIALLSIVLALSLIPSMYGSIPKPIIDLDFNEGSGTTAANSGSAGGELTLSAPMPMWSSNVPPGGGSSSLDFGTEAGGYYAESPDVISELGGLEKFTVTLWVNVTDSAAGSGGNRLVSWKIGQNGDGLDFVVLSNGGLHMAVNEWPDYPNNRPTTSSTGMIPTDAAAGADNWRFIALTYDSTLASDHVTYYFGSTSEPVAKDVSCTYPEGGAVGINIQLLTIGNFTGTDRGMTGRQFRGLIDEVKIFGDALTLEQIQSVMKGSGGYPLASGPSPADSAIYANTWVNLGWRAGDFAVSHDVYLGDNFDDVNNATNESETFRVNQTLDFYLSGFPGYAYPEGLVPGTTYYWRIDEINEAEPNSPWKGDVWSFSIPPKTAYFPDPADGSEFVDLNVKLTWTAGFGSKFHYIVFGEDFDEVNNAAAGIPNGTTNYNPGQLKLAKTYYWRVDESDGFETIKGQVWSFTTVGAVSGPNPADGAEDVSATQILMWDAGAVAASHDVYFGVEADAVANATTASPEYKGSKAMGDESYDPGKLMFNTTYYWRIDEVNGVNPDSPWKGNVWSFTIGNYIVIDNFEGYDVGNNEIWWSWKDGLGYVAHGNEPTYPGNGTGSMVGDETTASYTEEIIIHSGNQSMPFFYDNNKQGYANYSETELTLTDQRDWTEQGVANLSLWFRGYSASVGNFVEGPIGTYTMTGSGADIWNQADEFHFAYKSLSGIGSIVARVVSVDQTDNWAKAGVMIRETLEPGSRHAMTVVTPAQGVSFQRRVATDSDSSNTDVTELVAPYWVKIERDVAGNFTGSRSDDGSTWEMIGEWENIQMGANVYIGLAVTSHNAGLTCQAVFTNVTTTGNVSGQWTNQDIGIESNDAEPLYVAVSNSTGTPAVVVYDDPAATTIDTWTEWIIPLSSLADQGIVLTDVDRLAVGLGIRDNMTVPGGKGKIYIDDIRLYQTREAAE